MNQNQTQTKCISKTKFQEIMNTPLFEDNFYHNDPMTTEYLDMALSILINPYNDFRNKINNVVLSNNALTLDFIYINKNNNQKIKIGTLDLTELSQMSHQQAESYLDIDYLNVNHKLPSAVFKQNAEFISHIDSAIPASVFISNGSAITSKLNQSLFDCIMHSLALKDESVDMLTFCQRFNILIKILFNKNARNILSKNIRNYAESKNIKIKYIHTTSLLCTNIIYYNKNKKYQINIEMATLYANYFIRCADKDTESYRLNVSDEEFAKSLIEMLPSFITYDLI